MALVARYSYRFQRLHLGLVLFGQTPGDVPYARGVGLAAEGDLFGGALSLQQARYEDTDVFGATWVLIASPASGFQGEELTRTSELSPKTNVRLWTDDYSNLFKILK